MVCVLLAFAHLCLRHLTSIPQRCCHLKIARQPFFFKKPRTFDLSQPKADTLFPSGNCSCRLIIARHRTLMSTRDILLSSEFSFLVSGGVGLKPHKRPFKDKKRKFCQSLVTGWLKSTFALMQNITAHQELNYAFQTLWLDGSGARLDTLSMGCRFLINGPCHAEIRCIPPSGIGRTMAPAGDRQQADS